MIGGIIMTHGDNRGLVLPPAIAPIQVIIVPVAMHKEGVLEKAEELLKKLKSVCRIKVDKSDRSPGWKFAEYEMRGVPIRLEIGPKDIEKNQCVIVRRDSLEKISVSLESIAEVIPKLLKEIKDNMYAKALERRNEMTFTAKNSTEFNQIAKEKTGLIKAPWCGSKNCEKHIKEKTSFTSRCILKGKPQAEDKCLCCGSTAKYIVYWAKAY